MSRFRLVFVIALALLGSSCLSAEAQIRSNPKHMKPEDALPSAVRVTETDFHIELLNSSAHAGKIDFVVSNRGKQDHEFVIVPLSGERYGDPVAEIEHFPTGESRAIRADLKAGKYVFVCLMVSAVEDDPQSHMALGMNTPFEVTE